MVAKHWSRHLIPGPSLYGHVLPFSVDSSSEISHGSLAQYPKCRSNLILLRAFPQLRIAFWLKCNLSVQQIQGFADLAPAYRCKSTLHPPGIPKPLTSPAPLQAAVLR